MCTCVCVHVGVVWICVHARSPHMCSYSSVCPQLTSVVSVQGDKYWPTNGTDSLSLSLFLSLTHTHTHTHTHIYVGHVRLLVVRPQSHWNYRHWNVMDHITNCSGVSRLEGGKKPLKETSKQGELERVGHIDIGRACRISTVRYAPCFLVNLIFTTWALWVDLRARDSCSMFTSR